MQAVEGMQAGAGVPPALPVLTAAVATVVLSLLSLGSMCFLPSLCSPVHRSFFNRIGLQQVRQALVGALRSVAIQN